MAVPGPDQTRPPVDGTGETGPGLATGQLDEENKPEKWLSVLDQEGKTRHRHQA